MPIELPSSLFRESLVLLARTVFRAGLRRYDSAGH